MTEKHKILNMYLSEEKSIKEIARLTNKSRNTIRKYIREYEDNREKVLQNKDKEAKNQLIKLMTEEPRYNSEKRKPRVLTDEIKSKIKLYLEQNENRSRKQKMNSMDIYEALTNDGFRLSYNTVNSAVKIMTKKSKEAFIKQLYHPGDTVEFDWGEVKLEVNGVEKAYKMAVFTSAYNNFRYAYVYPKESTEFFLDAHVKFFEHIGGVYKTVVYDNMKVAVARFIGKNEKEATVSLQSISKYYGFDYRFCNVRRGNEKGHVEKSVDVIRSRAFKVNIKFETLLEANSHLLKVLNNENSKVLHGKNLSASDSLKEELKHMLPIIEPYDASTLKELRVDKYSTISVDQNRYSVPDHLVGEFVSTKIYTEKIMIFKDLKLTAEHTRIFGLQEWSLEILHYRKTLLKKPGALKGSLAFNDLGNSLKEIYYRYFEKNPKDFVNLLEIVKEYSLKKLKEVIDSLKENRINIELSTIKLVLERKDVDNLDKDNANNGSIENKALENNSEYNSVFNLNPLNQHQEREMML